MNHEVYLLTGSNLDDRETFLFRAAERLHEGVGAFTGLSSVYESEPWGYHSEFKFLNQVIRLQTTMGLREVLTYCMEVEASLGRIRSSALVSDRTIDIDILFFSDWEVMEPDLIIPHPRIVSRRFVLLPMVELSPLMVHPGNGKTMIRLLKECTDTSKVKVYKS